LHHFDQVTKPVLVIARLDAAGDNGQVTGRLDWLEKDIRDNMTASRKNAAKEARKAAKLAEKQAAKLAAGSNQ